MDRKVLNNVSQISRRFYKLLRNKIVPHPDCTKEKTGKGNQRITNSVYGSKMDQVATKCIYYSKDRL